MNLTCGLKDCRRPLIYGILDKDTHLHPFSLDPVLTPQYRAAFFFVVLGCQIHVFKGNNYKRQIICYRHKMLHRSVGRRCDGSFEVDIARCVARPDSCI